MALKLNTPVGLTLALLLGGCGDVDIKPDSASGKDFERAGAQQLFLGKLTDDYIDAAIGDNTDFKYLKIPDKGFLKLTVYWDNKHVPAKINIRDKFGVLLASRAHSAELEKDVIDLRVEPGTHFVELTTQEQASVYTVEALFQRFDYKPKDDYRPEADDFDVSLGDEDPLLAAEVPRARGRRGARHRPRGRRAAPRAQARARAGVQATIRRVVPGARGRGSVLTLNRGEAHGIRQGQTGTILNDDGTPLRNGAFRIIQADKKWSKARTSLKKGAIGNRRRVVIQ